MPFTDPTTTLPIDSITSGAIGGLFTLGSPSGAHVEIGTNGAASGIRLYAADGQTILFNADVNGTAQVANATNAQTATSATNATNASNVNGSVQGSVPNAAVLSVNGTIRAGSTANGTNRVEMGPAGLSLIKRSSSGVDTTTVKLDTATGVGTFTGTVDLPGDSGSDAKLQTVALGSAPQINIPQLLLDPGTIYGVSHRPAKIQSYVDVNPNNPTENASLQLDSPMFNTSVGSVMSQILLKGDNADNSDTAVIELFSRDILNSVNGGSLGQWYASDVHENAYVKTDGVLYSGTPGTSPQRLLTADRAVKGGIPYLIMASISGWSTSTSGSNTVRLRFEIYDVTNAKTVRYFFEYNQVGASTTGSSDTFMCTYKPPTNAVIAFNVSCPGNNAATLSIGGSGVGEGGDLAVIPLLGRR